MHKIDFILGAAQALMLINESLVSLQQAVVLQWMQLTGMLSPVAGPMISRHFIPLLLNHGPLNKPTSSVQCTVPWAFQ